MKKLNFNIKSWHSILYRSTWGEYSLPDNICGYFWTLIAAIILAPLCIVGHLINMFGRTYLCVAWIWFLYPVFCLGVGATYYKELKANPSISQILIAGVVGSIMVVAFLAALFGLVFLADKTKESWSKKHKKTTSAPKEKKPNPLIEGFKAFKGKYCTKIEWELEKPNAEECDATEAK